MLWGPIWSILVHFGAPHVRPHDPSMNWSDSYLLLSVHLIQKKIILVTQDKFETVCSVMLWCPSWSILVHSGAFWCTSCATPWPLHDLLWLLSSFKCSFNPKMDHISHSEQIRNTWLSHSMETILLHFGPFWCILVHFGVSHFGAPHVWPHDPFMTFPDSYPLSSVHLIQNEIILVTQDKFETLLLCHDMVTILVHFGPFWCTSWATPRPLSIQFLWSHKR